MNKDRRKEIAELDDMSSGISDIISSLDMAAE